MGLFGRLERLFRQPASRASYQTDMESDRWRFQDKVKDKSIKHLLCQEQSYKISLGHICFDRTE